MNEAMEQIERSNRTTIIVIRTDDDINFWTDREDIDVDFLVLDYGYDCSCAPENDIISMQAFEYKSAEMVLSALHPLCRTKHDIKNIRKLRGDQKYMGE